MPGVPSSRGCEACRKTKKKCDQIKPKCSRCKRLDINCVGAGCQRYKFQADSHSSEFHSQLSTASSKPLEDNARNTLFGSIVKAPSNREMSLASSLVSTFSNWDDLRYHITWTYGGYIEDIPARLGHNPALDAAAAALIASHSNLAGHCNKSDAHATVALKAYSHALATTRYTIASTSNGRDSLLLCAIMLLLICQAQLGHHNCSGSPHTQAAAEILKARGFVKAEEESEFEHKLMMALRSTILFQGLVSNNIVLSDKQWAQLVFNEFKGEEGMAVALQTLGHMPVFMSRGRKLMLMKATDLPGWKEGLEKLSAEVQEGYALLKEILCELKGRHIEAREAFEEAKRSRSPKLRAKTILWANWQRLHGLAHAIILIFNVVLQAVSQTEQPQLDYDAHLLSTAVLEIAEEAQVFRPLGASFMSISAGAAWCACPEKREELMRVFRDYRADFPSEEPVDSDHLNQEMNIWNRRLRLLE